MGSFFNYYDIIKMVSCMNKIYLVYGDEPYLIDEYIKKIEKEYSDYEKVCYDMLEVNVENAIYDALTISLFSSNKLIICNNSVFLTTQKCEIEHNTDSILKYLSSNTDNILIFTVNTALDKRKKLVKELENKSEVKVFNKLKDYELSKFIKDYLKKFSFNIDNDALNLFINKLNDDLYVITSELDKMILYKDNKKTINLDDVRLVTSKIINSDIFDLIDAITKKNINEALALYDDLVLMQEEEIKLIVILANQFRLIYQVKEMYKMGYSELDIANSLDVHPYRVKLAKNIDISSNDAIKYLRKLANLDELIKTGKIDKKEGFYKFMLSI